MPSKLGNNHWWFIIILSAFFTAPLIEFIVPVYFNEKTAINSFNETFSGEILFESPGFKLWEMTPFYVLLLASSIISRATSAERFNIIILSGYVGLMLLMCSAHVSYWADLYAPGIRHVSSTSALLFLFLPPWCVVSTGIGLLIGRGIVWAVQKD